MLDRNIGKILDKRYKIIELIAKGGMGNIYKAKDIFNDEFVCLKILIKDKFRDVDLSKFKQMLYAEIDVLKRIKSKYVTEYKKFFDYQGQIVIVIEYFNSITLKHYLLTKEHISQPNFLLLAKKIAKGFRDISKFNIIHGDITPNNILIDKDLNIKIIDFGISLIRDKNFDLSRGMGTPKYVSPEKLKDFGYERIASEMFSLGLVFYEMIIGKSYFSDFKKKQEIIDFILDPKKKFPSLATFLKDEGIAKIIEKMLDKDINNRYQDFDSLIIDLNKIDLQKKKNITKKIKDYRFWNWKIYLSIILLVILVITFIITIFIK